jgi:hypothetical protein
MASALFLAPQFLFNWRSGIGRHAIGTGALKLGRIWPSPTKLLVVSTDVCDSEFERKVGFQTSCTDCLVGLI